MNLRNRGDKMEKKLNSRNETIITQIPHHLEGDEEAKDDYIREHYPEAANHKGLVIHVMQYGEGSHE